MSKEEKTAKAKRLLQFAISDAMFKIVNSRRIDFVLLRETSLLAKELLTVIG